LSHERHDARHLPHHTLRVDDGVARIETGIGSLVDEYLLRKRIATRIEDLDDGRCAAIARAHRQKGLEAGVLVVRAGEALNRRSLLDQAALQRLVFDGELVLSDEIAADEGNR